MDFERGLRLPIGRQRREQPTTACGLPGAQSSRIANVARSARKKCHADSARTDRNRASDRFAITALHVFWRVDGTPAPGLRGKPAYRKENLNRKPPGGPSSLEKTWHGPNCPKCPYPLLYLLFRKKQAFSHPRLSESEQMRLPGPPSVIAKIDTHAVFREDPGTKSSYPTSEGIILGEKCWKQRSCA